MRRKIEFASVFLNQVIFGITPLILMKLLATYLPPSDFGNYSLLSSIAALVLALPFNPLAQGQIRIVSEYQETTARQAIFIVSSSVLYLLFIGIYLTLFVFLALLLRLSAFWQEALWSVFFFICSQVFWIYLIYFFNGLRKRVYPLMIALTALVLNILVLLTYFWFFHGENVTTIFYLLGISSISACLVVAGKYLLNTLLTSDWYIDQRCIKEIWRFSYPLVLMGGFVWLRSMTSRWYLDWYVSKEAVAAFSVLSSLAIMAPTALEGILTAYFMPIFYSRENQQPGYTRRKIKSILVWFGLLGLLTGFTVEILARWIMVIFSSAHYKSYAGFLFPMYMSFYIYIIASFATLVVFAEKRTRNLIIPNIIVISISIISSLCLIKYIGINGAVINFCLVNIGLALLLFWLAFYKK